MRILVTGAAGFIGSHLCEKLSELGHGVVGLDNFSDYYSVGLKRQNAHAAEKAGARIVEVDLATDPVSDILAGTDLVYHLAAQPGISAHVPLDVYVRNNLTATHNLLSECLKMNGKPYFINISTSSVYGYYATVPETVPPEPVSFYGVTKLAAEQLVMAARRSGNLQACSLRLFSVYGPRERPDKLYTRLIDSILNDRKFPYHAGSGDHLRSYSFVDDIVEGLVSVIARRERCNGEIINLGSDVDITTGRGMQIVEDLLGKKVERETLPPRPGDQLQTKADISKAREILGFNPRTRPEEGLLLQIEWYKKTQMKHVG